MKYLKKFNVEQDVVVEYTPCVYLIHSTGLVGYVGGELPVKIQHIDGTLYSQESWIVGGFTNDEANGVVILTEQGNILLAKEQYKCDWGGYSIVVEGLSKDFGAGESNTTNIINAIGDNGGVEYAALKASSYTFPDGKHGFLPSVDEWAAIAPYIKLINSYLVLVGGTTLFINDSSTSSWYASSYSTNGKYSFDDEGNELIFTFIDMRQTFLTNKIDTSNTGRTVKCSVLPIRILS